MKRFEKKFNKLKNSVNITFINLIFTLYIEKYKIIMTDLFIYQSCFFGISARVFPFIFILFKSSCIPFYIPFIFDYT